MQGNISGRVESTQHIGTAYIYVRHATSKRILLAHTRPLESLEAVLQLKLYSSSESSVRYLHYSAGMRSMNPHLLRPSRLETGGF